MAPLVEIRNLSRRFGATQALRAASLTVHAGQVHCLLGENGAGKSTLGKILAGLITADEGEILINGKRVVGEGVHQARANGISLAYQELSLADDLSVVDNLSLGREQHRKAWSMLNRREERKKCEQLLKRFSVDVSLDACIDQLSAGQRQLLEVAKALSSQPRLLVLDEPTATLNAIEKQCLFKVLKQLRAEGMAFVLVTHHVDDVLEIGDHVTLLKNGEVVDSFPMNDHFRQEDLLEKLCGKRSMARAAALPSNTDEHTALLSLHGLMDRYGTKTHVDIPRQQIIAFYGVVGCGNEGIARALVGLERSPTLAIELSGARYRVDAPYQALKRGISYLPPKRADGILADRSVRENINLSSLRAISRWGWIRQRDEARITTTHIADLNVKCASADIDITSLSGGNQQKVLIGRALAQASALIVLEEPSAGIDVGAKLAIHEIIRKRVSESGLSVVLVSSDLGEVLALADVVYTMFHGRIVNRYDRPTPDDQAAIIFDILGENASTTAQQGAL